MTEVFRTRTEPTQEPEIAPQAPKEQKSDELAGNEVKAQDEPTQEENNLEIWEGLNRRKFGEDYFNIREFSHEFPLKANFGLIDKYVKGELESRSYEKNTDNYKKVLQEIESEIGSENLEVFSRIKKIVGYIKAIQRLAESKRKIELYKNRDF